MQDVESGLGFGWVAIGAIGFVVAFVLAKLGWLTDTNASKFVTWAPCAVAAFFALGIEPSTSNPLISLLGRAAVFGLIWLVVGMVFAIGVAMGMEKANRGK